MHQYIMLDEELWFPSHEYADKDGLLAIGGDLSPNRLHLAYMHGIFPWYNQGDPILWWSPDPRFVLFLEDFHLSRKQEKIIRKNEFLISENCCFRQVIEYCAKIKRRQEDNHGTENANHTWLNKEMIEAYLALHHNKLAHSIEVWHTEKPKDNLMGKFMDNLTSCNKDGKEYYLVGGLYGVMVSPVFSGESMFSLMPEASRAALKYLVEKLKNAGHSLIDCQISSPHFIRMGARHISRQEFLNCLKK